jgi:sugar/nucleoside kinase (ribokinase family)
VKRIVVAGHSCVDLIPGIPAEPTLEPGELLDIGPLAMEPGGSVVNTGRALLELGVPLELVTTIGDDALGDYLRDHLAQLSPRHVIRRVEGVGTSYSVVIEHDGRSRTIWHHIGSAAAFTGEELDPTGAELVHLGYPTALPGLLADDASAFRAVLARIKAAHATSSVDLSTLPASQPSGHWPDLLRRVLPSIDVFTPSADDLVSIGWLPPEPSTAQIAEAADRLCAAGSAIVMVSDGARGAYLRTSDSGRLFRGGRALLPLAESWSGHHSWIPAEPVARVVTTNGAGDTSSAGLLYGILNGYAPAEAGRFAATLAARRIGGLGLADPTANPTDAATG